MVAKLVILLLVLAIVIGLAMLMVYLYLDNQAEREHEKELRQMDTTEALVAEAEDESSIDGQLERGRR